MTPLTTVSITARKVVRYGVYSITLFFLVRFAVQTAITLYRKFFPPAPPPPTVAFGKLPKIPFPMEPLANVTYKLETPDASLTKLAEQLPVFVMPPVTPKINAFNDAKDKAQKLKFSVDGQNIIENIPNVYIFKKKDSTAILTMNIISGTFSISYDLASDTTLLQTKPSSQEKSITDVTAFLQKAELYTEDLSGDPITQLIRVEGGTLKEAISLSEADFVKVNYFRKKIEFGKSTFGSITPDYPESNVWFITNGEDVVLGEYHYFPIDETKSATYPLKTSEILWKELGEGKAFIINPQNQKGEIVIRRIYLSYYDPGQSASYYQPVAVFEGDNNFFAVLPAVTDEYYGDK